MDESKAYLFNRISVILELISILLFNYLFPFIMILAVAGLVFAIMSNKYKRNSGIGGIVVFVVVLIMAVIMLI
jgi:hypothetical protein